VSNQVRVLDHCYHLSDIDTDQCRIVDGAMHLPGGEVQLWLNPLNNCYFMLQHGQGYYLSCQQVAGLFLLAGKPVPCCFAKCLPAVDGGDAGCGVKVPPPPAPPPASKPKKGRVRK
jgi:hypothetical protein